jgi:hypothetical protein
MHVDHHLSDRRDRVAGTLLARRAPTGSAVLVDFGATVSTSSGTFQISWDSKPGSSTSTSPE